MWCNDGRFTPAASDTPASSPARTCYVVSFVVSALLLMFAFTFATSHCATEGGWECSLIDSIKASTTDNFIRALQSPFLLRAHSHEDAPCARGLWYVYRYPFRINFLLWRCISINCIFVFQTEHLITTQTKWNNINDFKDHRRQLDFHLPSI